MLYYMFIDSEGSNHVMELCQHIFYAKNWEQKSELQQLNFKYVLLQMWFLLSFTNMSRWDYGVKLSLL